MLLILLASQIAAPQPVNFEKWFGGDDYPSSHWDAMETTLRPVTQTLVDAAGKIVGCRVETPSPDPQVDALACAIILKRGKFQPARWSDGSPVPGVWRKAIRFTQFGDPYDPIGDIELEVARLPNEKSPTFVTLAFAADADGRIGECTEELAPEAERKRQETTSPALVRAACDALTANWKPFTVLGPNGQKTRSVQNVSVMFSEPSKSR